MTPEEQLYTLMAQAEDLQSHAQTLQSRAKTALEGLPESVRAAGREVRALATRWIVIGAVVVMALGVVVAAGVSAYIRHDVGDLRDEARTLRAKIAKMRQTEAELADKTWRITLKKWENGERGIILPKGVTFVRQAKTEDGRDAAVITP